MKRRIFVTILLACCFMVCFAAIADLTGKWTGTLKAPDGTEVPLTYNFKADGDKLTGTGESPEGKGAIDSGKISGNSFSFKVTVNNIVYPHTGKFYGDSCGIDIGAEGAKLHTTLKRADK